MIDYSKLPVYKEIQSIKQYEIKALLNECINNICRVTILEDTIIISFYGSTLLYRVQYISMSLNKIESCEDFIFESDNLIMQVRIKKCTAN